MAETGQGKRRGVLLALAAEGMVPVIAGCAGALAGGPEAGMVGGMVGVAVGQAVEKVINFFGARIVFTWGDWFKKQSPLEQQQALAELASMPAEVARKEAEHLLDQLVLEPISPADREVAVSYLSLLPGSLDRALPREVSNGLRSLPPTVSLDEPLQMLSLLPVTLPPYAVGTEVPGTPYRLEGLLGSGGFGAVYKASTRSLQHLPLAIKFCLDTTLTQALFRERDNLERLMKAGGQDWSPRIVRLYGYDLEHKTPYLVYEFVTGGDLIRHLAEKREALGRPLDAREVFDLISQVVEALAFAHAHGLVHRDLKPANVLVEGGVLKLADFGLGGVSAARAAQVSRIGATTNDLLSIADQATLFRGAGTPLYMAPEQRRGLAPDPRHDLYSLGVMWYQMLVGDVSRELHPGWAKELTVRFGVPKKHLELIECCVGWFEERPKHAGELLRLLRDQRDEPEIALPAQQAPAPAPFVEATGQRLAAITQIAPADDLRRVNLFQMVEQLRKRHEELRGHMEALWNFTRPAAITAIVSFIFVVSQVHAFWAALFAAIFLAGLVGGVYYLVGLGRIAEARERLSQTRQAVAAEFPDLVKSWGGETALGNPEMVEQISNRLGLRREQEPVSGKSGTLRTAKLNPQRLREVADEIEAVKTTCGRLASFARVKALPLALVFLVSLGGGIGTGMGASQFYLAQESPLRHQAYERGTSVTKYFTARGSIIDSAEYTRIWRHLSVTATLLGMGSGIAVTGLLTWLLWRRSVYPFQILGGIALGLTFGVPAGLLTGGLYFSYQGPYLEHKYEKGIPTMTYFNERGSKLNEEEYLLQDRKITAEAAALGVIVGVFVGVGALILFQLVYHRQRKQAQREAQRAFARLDEKAPDVVLGLGGPESLNRPEAVVRLLGEA